MYHIIFNWKNGDSERIECEDFEAGEGKILLTNPVIDGNQVSFIVIMESSLHSYVGDIVKEN